MTVQNDSLQSPPARRQSPIARTTKNFARNATWSRMGLSGHAVTPSLEARAPVGPLSTGQRPASVPPLVSHRPARPIPDRISARGSIIDGIGTTRMPTPRVGAVLAACRTFPVSAGARS